MMIRLAALLVCTSILLLPAGAAGMMADGGCGIEGKGGSGWASLKGENLVIRGDEQGILTYSPPGDEERVSLRIRYTALIIGDPEGGSERLPLKNWEVDELKQTSPDTRQYTMRAEFYRTEGRGMGGHHSGGGARVMGTFEIRVSMSERDRRFNYSGEEVFINSSEAKVDLIIRFNEPFTGMISIEQVMGGEVEERSCGMRAGHKGYTSHHEYSFRGDWVDYTADGKSVGYYRWSRVAETDDGPVNVTSSTSDSGVLMFSYNVRNTTMIFHDPAVGVNLEAIQSLLEEGVNYLKEHATSIAIGAAVGLIATALISIVLKKRDRDVLEPPYISP